MIQLISTLDSGQISESNWSFLRANQIELDIFFCHHKLLANLIHLLEQKIAHLKYIISFDEYTSQHGFIWYMLH